MNNLLLLNDLCVFMLVVCWVGFVVVVEELGVLLVFVSKCIVLLE